MDNFYEGKLLYGVIQCSECGSVTEVFCDEVSPKYCPACNNNFYTTKDIVIVTKIDHEKKSISLRGINEGH